MKLLAKLILLLSALSATLMSAEATQMSLKDPAIADHDRIIYWLQKRGELAIDASEVERKRALNDYLAKARHGHYRPPEAILKAERAATHRQQQLQKKNPVLAKNGVVKNVKVLVVMVDFPDLPNDDNQLTSNDTDMFYSDYPASHYEGLVFSGTGYPGPSGQNLMSARQYYIQESGGTLVMDGAAFGWIRADNNAASYGANDPDNNDDDIDAPALVKEAVAKAVLQNSINLAEYDQEDPYDLDADGNVSEPDGYIDHVMIFHSSIGEESGGGILAEDAIWSHRYFVDAAQGGYTIPDTNYKLFGYTIQPIDAAVGVVVHEFGHDLGLPDEYNTDSSDGNEGSPVGAWSLMASGSWTGQRIRGTQPTGFSPYAKDYLQQRYGGNWVNMQRFNLAGLSQTPETLELRESVDNDATTNLIKVDVPGPAEDFFPPYSGSYQYYSGSGDLKQHHMSFDLSVPSATINELQMRAHWRIEDDYDYVQVKVGNVSLEGNHTRATNRYHPGAHFITGNSLDISGAEGSEGWVNLVFDMSAYAGSTVTVTISYITDPSVGDYGFVADEIQLISDGSRVYFDGAEDNPVLASLDGFSAISGTRTLGNRYYYVQMRSYNDVDAGLASRNYDPGMVVWFGDPAYNRNHSNVHPGYGFIGVVDANQELLTNPNTGAPYSTTTQIRDAAFSLYGQAVASQFIDTEDYTSPGQPASGMVLPKNGLRFIIQSQATNNTWANVLLDVLPLQWRAEFNNTKTFRTVSFTNLSVGTGDASAVWDFGDGNSSTEWEPTHIYASSGSYNVSLTVTTASDGTTDVFNQTVVIVDELRADFQSEAIEGRVSFTATATGGEQPLTYSWDFGDGSSSESGAAVTHQYTESGTYAVILTITSNDSQTTSSSASVVVYISPTADFDTQINNLSVTFTDLSAGGQGPLSYAWDFGDGNTSTIASPSHTYATGGTYSVSLTITDAQNTLVTTTQTITVSQPAPPPAPTPSSGSGGGGSTEYWLILMLAAWYSLRQTKQLKCFPKLYDLSN